jgi:hypothetical protein
MYHSTRFGDPIFIPISTSSEPRRGLGEAHRTLYRAGGLRYEGSIGSRSARLSGKDGSHSLAVGNRIA